MEPSKQITVYIASLKDWRGKMVGRMRAVVHKADPDITEEWKWGTPVFSHDGLVVAIGAFKDHVGMNFFKGASLKDPRKMFNGGLEAKTSRSANFREGDKIDEAALADLIRSAVALGAKGPAAKKTAKKKVKRK